MRLFVSSVLAALCLACGSGSSSGQTNAGPVDIVQDPCRAAGTWAIQCAPEPGDSTCPITTSYPHDTYSVRADISLAVATYGGDATFGSLIRGDPHFPGSTILTPVAEKFDPSTCTIEASIPTAQCGEGATNYVIRDGALTGTRRGGATCCTTPRQCTGTNRTSTIFSCTLMALPPSGLARCLEQEGTFDAPALLQAEATCQRYTGSGGGTFALAVCPAANQTGSCSVPHGANPSGGDWPGANYRMINYASFPPDVFQSTCNTSLHGTYSAAPLSVGGLNVQCSPISCNLGWMTGVLSTSQVFWGLTPALGNSTPLDTSRGYVHTVVVVPLQRATAYYFQAVSIDADGSTAQSDIITGTTMP